MKITRRSTPFLLRAQLPRGAAFQRGLSLLEVLIAVVVLAVGLLGLARLQVLGLQQNHGAYLRTQAVIAADDLAERIRANRSNRASYAVDWGGVAASGLAAEDLAQWQDLLGEYLPGGEGKVEVEAGRVTIRVRWDDERAGAQEPDDKQAWPSLTVRTEV